MEIELRAFIKNKKNLLTKLKKLKSKLKSKTHIIDYYFCSKKKHSFKQVAQHKPDSYGLRIRKTSGKTELNCKVLENPGDHNAFHEY